jgi:chorismate synthase
MNSFGRVFRVSLFGESRGECVGAQVDGCPAGLRIGDGDFREDMARRKAGAFGTTKRREPDKPHISSGTFNGRTTGAPILIVIGNDDASPERDSGIIARPGHADLAASKKFGGFNDTRGGGQFSGRLTAPLVAAGVVAKKVVSPVRIEAKLADAGGSSDVRGAIEESVAAGDTIGGTIECRAAGVPAGLGEPLFDSVESVLSHALFAIPGVKGVEFGKGFACAGMRGSELNALDARALMKPTKLKRRKLDGSGGINGGLTNGNDLSFRVAIRPASTLSMPMNVVDLKSRRIVRTEFGGRHDACFAQRAPVIVEAAAAIVLADLMLIAHVRPRVAGGD